MFENTPRVKISAIALAVKAKRCDQTPSEFELTALRVMFIAIIVLLFVAWLTPSIWFSFWPRMRTPSNLWSSMTGTTRAEDFDEKIEEPPPTSSRVSGSFRDSSLTSCRPSFTRHLATRGADALAMGNDLNRQAALLSRDPVRFNEAVSAQAYLRNLTEVIVFDGSGKILARSGLAFALTFEPITDEMRARGITILFVSHAVADVKAIGDRALWLEHGRVVEIGDPDRVVARYLAAMVEKDSTYLHIKAGTEVKRQSAGPVRAPEVVETIPNIDHRYGDGRAEVLGIAILDEQGRPLHLLEPSSNILVRISVRAHADLALQAAREGSHSGHRNSRPARRVPP